MSEPIFSEDPMMAAMQASLLKENEPKAPVVAEVIAPVETKVETPVAPVVEAPKVDAPPVIENIETKVAPEVKPEAPIVQKSFDETFLEKFDNKFKSVDEIKALLDKPQVKFANDKLAHWNELAEKGIEINEEFLALQSKDYDSWTNASQIAIEAMKLLKPEDKGLSDKALNAQLEKKYKISEWTDKDPADYTEEDEVNIELFERDALNDREALTKYKNERVLAPTVDPTLAQALAEQEAQGIENWKNLVETDLVKKDTRFSTALDDKGEQLFDYDISEQSLKQVGEIMKALPTDSNAFFGQFIEKDKNGNPVRNHKALRDFMLKAMNYENAVKLSHEAGIAKEALRAEREVKNTNFKPAESGSAKTGPSTPQEQLAKAIQNQKV